MQYTKQALEAHLVTGSANNRGKDGTGSIITGESSLDQTRTIVAHERGSLIVVTHDWSFLEWSWEKENMC